MHRIIPRDWVSNLCKTVEYVLIGQEYRARLRCRCTEMVGRTSKSGCQGQHWSRRHLPDQRTIV